MRALETLRFLLFTKHHQLASQHQHIVFLSRTPSTVSNSLNTQYIPSLINLPTYIPTVLTLHSNILVSLERIRKRMRPARKEEEHDIVCGSRKLGSRADDVDMWICGVYEVRVPKGICASLMAA